MLRYEDGKVSLCEIQVPIHNHVVQGGVPQPQESGGLPGENTGLRLSHHGSTLLPCQNVPHPGVRHVFPVSSCLFLSIYVPSFSHMHTSFYACDIATVMGKYGCFFPPDNCFVSRGKSHKVTANGEIGYRMHRSRIYGLVVTYLLYNP